MKTETNEIAFITEIQDFIHGNTKL